MSAGQLTNDQGVAIALVAISVIAIRLTSRCYRPAATGKMLDTGIPAYDHQKAAQSGQTVMDIGTAAGGKIHGVCL